MNSAFMPQSLSNWRLAIFAIGLTLLNQSGAAEDYRVSLVHGTGKDAGLSGVAVTTHPNFWVKKIQNGAEVTASIEIGLSRISGDTKPPNGPVTVLGITPVLRFVPEGGKTYAEFGIGANYFDERQITSTKSLGTKFEFGDLAGFGIRFGEKKSYEIGYRFIHYSNASISTHNPGLDFHQLRFQAAY